MNDKLAKALVAAQAEMPIVPMNAVNFFKNKYANLGSVINAVRPVLAKHGLAFSQVPIGSGGEVGIKTVLMHESGEFIEDKITLPLSEERGKSTAQVAGSIITYLRRYALSAMLGIYAEEDMDGNGGNTTKKATPPKQSAPPRPTPAPTGNIFETVKSSTGAFYKDIPADKLSFMYNAVCDNLKKDGLTQQNRDELELKRDAAKFYIEEKKG